MAAAALPREERPRSNAHLRGPLPVCASTWRGHSGQTYGCTVYDLGATGLTAENLAEFGECIVIPVAREKCGLARNLGPTACSPAGARALLATFAKRGATEAHVALAATSAAARAVVVSDLQP